MNRAQTASNSRSVPFTFNLISLLAIAAMLFVGLTPRSHASAAPLAAAQRPELTGGFDAAATGKVTLNGAHFTPGGDVYVAIYDQAGARLYEHRLAFAGPSIATQEAEALNGSYHMPVVDEGTFSESFDGLCGTAIMARALDESTKTWSEFLSLNANCATAAETANDLNASLILPMAAPTFTKSGLLDPPLLLAAPNAGDGGAVSISGFGFTAKGRVYVAIYDAMGAKLYPNRWVTSATLTHVNGMSDGSAVTLASEGIFNTSLAWYCGSNVMIRAYDQGTQTWSNWVKLPANCAAGAGAPDRSANKIG